MATEGEHVTIIKRRKVVAGGGHHGGAWKVAYADFVTAMMAFFLLLWLLNATTEEQRQGIADYFAPSVPISRQSGGGNGLFSGDSVFAEDRLIRDGTGGSENAPSGEDRSRGDTGHAPESTESGGAAEAAILETLFRTAADDAGVPGEALNQVLTRLSDEGLVIDIFARQGAPIFETGSAEPTERLRSILSVIANVLDLVPNGIAIEGHTDATPFGGGDYDNWTLSSDRAHAVRRALTGSGLPGSRIARVVGRADTDPVLDDPLDPRNRRIVITVLRTPHG
ncbi:MAG: flagellar motor protein MotB [Rubricella sp.]